MMSAFGRELRHAARALTRARGFTVAAVVSIALGIAATTSVFSIVDAALFRPPPLEQPDRLAVLFMVRQRTNASAERTRWSWSRFRLLQRSTAPFESVGSFSQSVLAITGEDAEPITAEVVSASYLPTLRVLPFIGRAFDPDDDDPATAHPVALIGFDLWQHRFGGQRSAIGRRLEINGAPLTIIGVLPRDFRGLTGRAELWIPPTMPARLSYADYQNTNQNFISVIGRVRDGIPLRSVAARLAALGAAIERSIPSSATPNDDRVTATAVPLSEARVDPSTRTPMLLLLAAAACVLALVCANVAGLLLGRAVSRRREFAIRLATGASRSRLVRQLLVESGVIALAGGALGVLFAAPIVSRLTLPTAAWRGRNFYGAIGEFATARLDARVLVFAVGVSALTVLGFGLVPALRATRVNLTDALKNAAGSGSYGFDLRHLIVGGETALAIVLLASGGLLAAGWRRVATSNPGFDPQGILTFLIRPSETVYPAPRAPELVAKVVAALEQLPNVESASVDGCAPVGPGCANSTLYIVGKPMPRPEDAPPVLRHYIAPDHFRVLRVPLLRGREFTAADRAGSNRVAIIDELAAKRFWPNEDPIGRRVWFGGGSSFDRPDSSAEIVGIVGDVAYQTFDDHPFQPDFYTPFAQFTYASRTVLVRTRGEPLSAVPAIRRALHDADPTLAMFDVRSMDDVMGNSWARLRYQTRIVAVFALVALAIAAMGIFAVIAHAISSRQREIGIRAALGATPLQLVAAVGAHGARPAAIGACCGLAAAIGIGRVLASLIHGIQPADRIVFGGVTVSVILVITVTSALAGRRALTVDPAISLKSE